MSSVCYCGSGQEFEDCCGSIINGKRKAETALELMKSRYSAYCTVAGAYLMATTHLATRFQYHQESIEAWARESEWKGLKIISTQKGTALDEQGEVSFQAFYNDEQKKSRVHYEHSFFVKQQNEWFYHSGKIIPINRNDSCPCGSGKKYKKCCGT